MSIEYKLTFRNICNNNKRTSVQKLVFLFWCRWRESNPHGITSDRF